MGKIVLTLLIIAGALHAKEQTAEITVPFEAWAFQTEQRCEDRGSEKDIDFTFTQTFQSSRENLVNFYWSKYQALYNQFKIVHQTDVEFYNIFHGPFNHWNLEGPYYISRQKVSRSSDYDFKKLCSAEKKSLLNTQYALRLVLTRTPDQGYSFGCDDLCYQNATFESRASLITQNESGIKETSTHHYGYRTKNHSKVDLKYCEGLKKPDCTPPDSW